MNEQILHNLLRVSGIRINARRARNGTSVSASIADAWDLLKLFKRDHTPLSEVTEDTSEAEEKPHVSAAT